MDKSLTGVERFFSPDELIVTKTDLKGRITYANSVFLRMSSLTLNEAIGAPHSIIRHPAMPRVVFKVLWDEIQAGNEIFAYVLNRATNGDHYWVLAHVTPSLGEGGTVIGYHSNRRVPDRNVIANTIAPFYAKLLAEEARHGGGREGIAAAATVLTDFLCSKGASYEDFIFSLDN